MKRLLLTALLTFVLAGCGQEPAAQPATPAPETGAPATPAEDAAPADEANATEDGAATDEEASDSAEPATGAEASAEGSDATDEEASDSAEPATGAEASAEGSDATVADVPPPSGPPPREGVDFEVLPTPQPTYGTGPGIEVAEVFSYTCIHCANLQPHVNTWKARLPADVRFVYVPAAFGGAIDNFARGFFAAEATGLLDSTHDAMFSAVL